MRQCEICKHNLVDPVGRSNDIAIIFEDFTAETYGGQKIPEQFGYYLLRTEMGKLGVDIYQARVTSMWLHAPIKNFDDAQWNFQQAILEAMGTRFVLLLGSGATKFFLGKTATAISGIPMKSDLLGAEYVVGTLNPNSALAGCNGEVILGIQQFAKLVRERRNK